MNLYNDCLETFHADLRYLISDLEKQIDGTSAYQLGELQGVKYALDMLNKRLYEMDCMLEDAKYG